MNDLELHVAGATVRHQSPFAALEVPLAQTPLDGATIKEWVVPVYMQWPKWPVSVGAYLRERRDRLTPGLVVRLLSDFNWRPREAAALFAAVRNFRELTAHIGRLLLRSDVCYAGATYAIALARFGSDEARGYLREYLDYYLRRHDLYFDQGDVIAALHHLAPAEAEEFLPLWEAFATPKYWKLDDKLARFRHRLAAVEQIEVQLQS